MLQSMTAFARVSEKVSGGMLTWEMRSVNHRYLELGLRLPEALRGLEPQLRELAKNYMSRGKVEASLRLQSMGAMQVELDVNKPLIEAILQANQTVTAMLPADPAPININDILRWPGVVSSNETPDETMNKAVQDLFASACKQFQAARSKEGESLAVGMRERLQKMQTFITTLMEDLPNYKGELEARMAKRFEKLTVEVDSQRLEQEILFYLQKADVAEELDRLQVHVTEFQRQLELDEPVGRRLDFLSQEMNREANTLGAKAFNANVSHASVELKVLIEQIREQVQNVE